MGSLVAGANAALTAENPGLSKILVGLGWKSIPSRGPQSELVPLAIMCDTGGRAISNDHLVFFNQIASPDAVTYTQHRAHETIVNLGLRHGR
jgi:tellurium resistance protein TerD